MVVVTVPRVVHALRLETVSRRRREVMEPRSMEPQPIVEHFTGFENRKSLRRAGGL